MKKFFALLIIFFALVATPISAQQNEDLHLPNQKIYPGAMTYPVKRAWEKMWEKMPGSKTSYYKQLTLTRLAELEYIAKNKNIGELQTTNERFAYYAGKLTESASDSDKQEIKNDFEKYIEKLEELKTNFEFNTSYWMLMEHSINSLRSYNEKLDK